VLLAHHEGRAVADGLVFDKGEGLDRVAAADERLERLLVLRQSGIGLGHGPRHQKAGHAGGRGLAHAVLASISIGFLIGLRDITGRDRP
jgi:hypothetical protein